MRREFASDLYLEDIKVVSRIEIQKFGRAVFFYELENGKILGSEFQKMNKNIHCECGKVSTIKKINPERKYVCRHCGTSGEKNPMYGNSFYKSWVRKYGKEIADKKMEDHSNKTKGDKNHFFGKNHSDEQKNKWSIDTKGRYSGGKNPMSGRSVYSLWVEKYGEDKAKELLNSQSYKMSEIMKGEGNSMYGKSVESIWGKKYNKEEIEKKCSIRYKKIQETFTEKRNSGEWAEIRKKISTSLKNREITSEHRINLRKSLLKYISKNFPEGKGFQPFFNTSACVYFDKISKENNINIQHALNGGEYHIKELGYFVDGYDKENNTIYEYDESFHFNIDGSLKEKDVMRQKEIEDFLKCKFIRIKQTKNQ